MEKVVRVIKLHPGEAVLSVAEDNPAPCPCGMCCMGVAPDPDDEHFPRAFFSVLMTLHRREPCVTLRFLMATASPSR